MKDDAISRHGVSAWLDNMGYSKLADAVMDKDRFPSAQPEQRWIPCAPETMPENNDEVFVTYTVNGKKQRYVETAMWYDGDEGYWASPWDEYRVPGTKVEVIAWMPLPEPYKGG